MGGKTDLGLRTDGCGMSGGGRAQLERRTSAVFIIYRHRLFHDILLGVLRPESVVGAAAVHEVPMGRLLQDLRRARPDIVIVEQEANDNAAARVLAAAWMLQRVSSWI